MKYTALICFLGFVFTAIIKIGSIRDTNYNIDKSSSIETTPRILYKREGKIAAFFMAPLRIVVATTYGVILIPVTIAQLRTKPLSETVSGQCFQVTTNSVLNQVFLPDYFEMRRNRMLKGNGDVKTEGSGIKAELKNWEMMKQKWIRN